MRVLGHCGHVVVVAAGGLGDSKKDVSSWRVLGNYGGHGASVEAALGGAECGRGKCAEAVTRGQVVGESGGLRQAHAASCSGCC